MTNEMKLRLTSIFSDPPSGLEVQAQILLAAIDHADIDDSAFAGVTDYANAAAAVTLALSPDTKKAYDGMTVMQKVFAAALDWKDAPCRTALNIEAHPPLYRVMAFFQPEVLEVSMVSDIKVFERTLRGVYNIVDSGETDRGTIVYTLERKPVVIDQTEYRESALTVMKSKSKQPGAKFVDHDGYIDLVWFDDAQPGRVRKYQLMATSPWGVQDEIAELFAW